MNSFLKHHVGFALIFGINKLLASTNKGITAASTYFESSHIYIHKETSTFFVFIFTNAAIGKGIVGEIVLFTY